MTTVQKILNGGKHVYMYVLFIVCVAQSRRGTYINIEYECKPIRKQ